MTARPWQRDLDELIRIVNYGSLPPDAQGELYGLVKRLQEWERKQGTGEFKP